VINMTRRKWLATIGGAVMLGLTAGAGGTAPIAQSMPATSNAANGMDMIQNVHSCNRICRRGPVEEWGGAVRWHRHVGPACRVVRCRPE
jgi:hypothetical protein